MCPTAIAAGGAAAAVGTGGAGAAGVAVGVATGTAGCQAVRRSSCKREVSIVDNVSIIAIHGMDLSGDSTVLQPLSVFHILPIFNE